MRKNNNIIMFTPEMFDLTRELYFKENEATDSIMTVPSLALALGFNTTKQLVDTLEDYEEGKSPYPEKSIQILQQSLTKLEDHYLRNGLKARFPAALVKFCLGAYHKLQEKEPPPQPEAFQPNQAIQIVFQNPTAQLGQPNGATSQPVIELNAQA